MGETLTVHRLGDSSIELEREQCWLFDRSRYLTGQACPRKRYLQYHWGGRGVETARRSEDLALGSAVHKGLEVMLGYGLDGSVSLEEICNVCGQFAYREMIEAGQQGLMIQDSETYGDTSPDLAQLLIEEQANLAYALVWAFGRRRLASLLERYEVVAVEPEILWLLGYVGRPPSNEPDGSGGEFVRQNDGKAIVMMSRPDAVLRSRTDRKLWTVSWKTSKRFDQEYLEKLECDVQGVTEGLAVQAMYGEEVGGAFYTYFLKGDKKFNADLGMKRYESPLIRPYTMWTGVGEPQYKATYQWTDEVGATKRLGKGWERTDVWKSLTMPEWLEMLDSGVVQPEASRDWLGEAVAEPLPQPFVPEGAERWRIATLESEARWAGDVEREGRQLHTGSCHDWGRACAWFSACWRGETVEQQLASGRKVVRTPNHPAEME